MFEQFPFNLLNRENKLIFLLTFPYSQCVGGGVFRQNLTLNLNDAKPTKTKKPFGTLDLHGLTDAGNLSSRSSGGMSFNAGGFNRLNMALIDDSIPLERQG